MYDAFDEFFSHDSWDSYHWQDEERFFQALDKVVRSEGFSVLDLRTHIAKRYAQQYPSTEKSNQDRRRQVEDYLVERADMVRRYLGATNR